MTDTPDSWTEDDSLLYQKLAAVAVPDREEQMATMVALLPFDQHAQFTAVELGSGEGYLSEVLLECFPKAAVIGLDGSDEMRSTSSSRLERFGGRFRAEPFDITDFRWLERAHGASCVVSSLCVHHLYGDDKQRMFASLAPILRPGGALIIADLVEPRSAVAREYFAAAWDHDTQRRSRERLGNEDGWQVFRDTEWNLYRHPDEMDRPSPLPAQLDWLSQAGFEGVDCFWLKAGHAIYGGYTPGGVTPVTFVGFERALEVAERALRNGTT
jgi:tRNA (cmo5U34)-methyltransferase